MGKIIIEEMKSPQLDDRVRKIRVCLPETYDRMPEKRYPVLYMHDGQNMVDPSPLSGYSWNVESILNRLEKNGEIDGIIVVGIDTPDEPRFAETTEAIAKKAENQVRKSSPGKVFLPEALRYGKFLLETLKPYIDNHYRTLPDREHCGMFGSSGGGIVSLYLGTIFNDTFGVFGAFSPVYGLVIDDLFQLIKAKTYLPETKIYHDMGAKEVPFARWTFLRMANTFDRMMRKKGFDSDHLLMVIDPTGRPTELFWQERLPGFFRFAFPKQK